MATWDTLSFYTDSDIVALDPSVFRTINVSAANSQVKAMLLNELKARFARANLVVQKALSDYTVNIFDYILNPTELNLPAKYLACFYLCNSNTMNMESDLWQKKAKYYRELFVQSFDNACKILVFDDSIAQYITGYGTITLIV